MTTYYPELAARVRGQRTAQPELYGDFEFDFGAMPSRFADGPDEHSSLPGWRAAREPILADEKTVELMRTATLLGDVVADPYAALVRRYGMKSLVAMLVTACREGIGAVPDAPDELVNFIAAMESTPDWLDMDLVVKGARYERIPQAFLAPYVIRGAFLGTFINTYAALPMALTGALTSKRARHRVHETATFFAVTAMPGGLDRYGPGFEAAAMVRLMHSMVRYNALRRSDKWDRNVYGLPVPQVDQMPAGLISIYLLSYDALRAGRTEFNSYERAVLEFSRYRCFLLGLPEELLPTTPGEIVHVFHARAALLRDGFDDETCGELVRSTMAAYLRPTHSAYDRIAESVERSWSRYAYCLTFCNGNTKKSAAMGVPVSWLDKARVGLTAPVVLGRFLALSQLNRVPGLSAAVDAHATHELAKRLKRYGKAEFTTDVHAYPAGAAPGGTSAAPAGASTVPAGTSTVPAGTSAAAG